MQKQQVLEAIEQAVERHQLFGDLLTTAEKQYLLDRGIVRSVMPGVQLCRQFQRDNRVFILVVGEVEVTAGSDAGKTHISTLKQGEIFGEIAALFGMPRVCDVTVSRPSVVLEIPSEVLNQIIDARTELRDAVIQRFKHRVTETALRGVPLLRYLPDDSMRILIEHSALVGAPPGSILVQEGEAGDAFYVVVYGNLRVSHHINNKHINLALLRPGDYFGEWSLLTGAPRAATVSALSQTQLVCIEREAFLTILKDNPTIRDRIDLEAHNRHDKLMSTDQRGSEQRNHESLDRIVDIIKKNSD
ncbi:MAG: cyclic nucleotide-binding domain-containing protein [Gammaproteobacteria bacterium]|nr:cyclic nucleotide-binding domain-containing protein [Gammaproteobacteria bacterium]